MTDVERYDNWMRNTVKSIHYSNNEAMTIAYQKLSKRKRIKKKEKIKR